MSCNHRFKVMYVFVNRQKLWREVTQMVLPEYIHKDLTQKGRWASFLEMRTFFFF